MIKIPIHSETIPKDMTGEGFSKTSRKLIRDKLRKYLRLDEGVLRDSAHPFPIFYIFYRDRYKGISIAEEPINDDGGDGS